ncbi:MAG: BrnA antitoxin family protein [Beijerinckiaceae bacterium]|jgi:uncharacterized protein (DUF4415 family)
MADKRPRRPAGVFETAEAVFKAPAKQAPPLPPKPRAIPKAKETISLRIDQDVLEHFQEQGPGWQDRLNAMLRKAIGIDEVP